MTSWEYLVADVPHLAATYTRPSALPFMRDVERTGTRLASHDDAEYEAWLNALGREGWEAIKLEHYHGVFKRPRPSPPYRGTP